jgi:hypothetical protein
MPDEIMVDPFSSDAFTAATLTDSINILPNQYGLLAKKNLFPDRGVPTRAIIIEEKDGVLTLLQTQPLGSPGDYNKGGKRRVRTFHIPHIPLEDALMPQDYAGIRAFGSASALSQLVDIVNNKLQEIKNKHDITREFHRMGALKGIILDADGTVIYNLFTEFGITQKEVDFHLDVSTTNVRNLCMSVNRHIEQNLKGEVMTNTECLCSPDFFDALVAHESVEKVFAGYQEAVDKLGGDPRKGFKFGGITFEEYNGSVPNASGTLKKLIEDGEAHCYPLGTMNTFSTYNAPADFLETVNTIGQPYYVKTKPRDFNRGMDFHSQSNPLAMCKRPAVLVKLTA